MMLRRCTVEDAVAIAALEERSFGEEAWSAAQVAGSLLRPGGFGLLLPDQGYAIGWSFLGEAELLRIGADPACRGQGVGARLLGETEGLAAALGAERLFLEVKEGNTPAIRLYERGGWTACGRRRRYYSDGRDALLYELELQRAATSDRS